MGKRVLIACAVLVASVVTAGTIEDAARLAASGRVDEARTLLRTHLLSNPEDHRAILAAAELEFDGTRSQDRYRAALRLARDVGDEGAAAASLIATAYFYYASGFYNNAQRIGRQVRDRYPGTPEAKRAILLIGRSLLAAGEAGPAVDELEPFLTEPDESLRIPITYVWAEAALASGQPAQVAEALSPPAWRSRRQAMNLLTRAYQSVGTDRQVRNSRWRARLALRAWEAESLAAISRPAPPGRAIVRAPEPTSEPAPAASEASPTTAPPVATPTPAAVSTGHAFSLQVGAFGNRDNASRLQKTIEAGGYVVSIRRTGSLHRVLVGAFGTRDEARAAIPAVKRLAGTREDPVLVRNPR